MARRQTQQQIYDALLAKYDREIADAFLAAILAARDAVDLRSLAEAIDRGDLQAAAALLRLDQAALFPLTEAVRGAFMAGGLSVASAMPVGAVFGFDGRHVRAERIVSARAGTLVQGIADDTLPMLRAVVLDGVQRGQSGAAVARDIVGRLNRATGQREGGFLGLTTQQTDAAIRARQELADLDPAYFNRQLRDRRLDPLVRRAITEGKPLSQTDIDRVTLRYRDRMAVYRGQVIARNEAHTAMAEGRHEGFAQVVDQGGQVTKRWQWNDGGQKDPREDHQAMSSAPARPYGQPFIMADGTAMQFPHDPAGGAKHSIGCRCIAVYRVVV